MGVRIFIGHAASQVAGADVVRFVPPYNVTTAELDEAVEILKKALQTGAGK